MTAPDLPRPLRAALSPGEVVLWSGRPPATMASRALGIAGLGRRLGVAGLAALALGIAILIVTPGGAGEARPLPAVLVALGALAGLAGIGLLVHGHATRSLSERITYLVTDLRAYQFEQGIGADPLAWDLSPAHPPLVLERPGGWLVLFTHRVLPGPPDGPVLVKGSGFEHAPADAALLSALGRFGTGGVSTDHERDDTT